MNDLARTWTKPLVRSHQPKHTQKRLELVQQGSEGSEQNPGFVSLLQTVLGLLESWPELWNYRGGQTNLQALQQPAGQHPVQSLVPQQGQRVREVLLHHWAAGRGRLKHRAGYPVVWQQTQFMISELSFSGRFNNQWRLAKTLVRDDNTETTEPMSAEQHHWFETCRICWIQHVGLTLKNTE